MTNLYIITGPAGIGKSTISKALAERKNKSVLIEGDEIYHQVVGGYVPAWKEKNHLDVFWKVCLNTIETYLTNGYDVIFNYIIYPINLNKIREAFNNYKIKFVVLMSDEQTLLKRDQKRPLDCQMHERCLVLLNNFKNIDFDNNYILNTSNLSIEETIDNIENDNKFFIK